MPNDRRICVLSVLALLAGAASGACASAGPAGPGGPGAPEAGARAAGAPRRPATPAEQAAERVRRVSVSPDSLELLVGDSARVRVAALDSAGTSVEGAPLRSFVSGRAAAYDDSSGYVKALEPGTATLYGVVAVPPARPGVAGRSLVGHATIHVSPLPVIRVELTGLPGQVYAGTRTRFEATAFSRVGEREGAPIAWSSSDSSVLELSPHGLARALGPGRATVTAASGGAHASATVKVVASPVRSLTLKPASLDTTAGDVVHLTATARDAGGKPVAGVPVRWSVAGPEGAGDVGAYLDESGTFVAERPGLYWVTASAGDRTAVTEISAGHRPYRIPMEAVGHGVVHGHATSALAVFEGVDGHDYAYTGTQAAGAGGDVVYAWDVTDPARPVMTDSVVVDARAVNDIEINDTRQIAVITREGASDHRNGIVLLDIRIPAHPRVLTTYTEGLAGGVHVTRISGKLLYAVNDGTRAIDILDISDPSHPRQVGHWQLDQPGRYLRNITIRDGLAYVSAWHDGLVILDVGAGIAGGTPTKPVEVSRLAYRTRRGEETFGNTSAAVRSGGYVFTADEIADCPDCVDGPRGYVHVIDVSDIRHPKEVASFRVPEAGAHALRARGGRLYVAYFQGGLRVVDISGELRGDLYRQGREIGWFDTASPDAFEPNAARAWAARVFKGHVFVTDMNSGLWILKFTRGDGATGAGAAAGPSDGGASGGGS